MIKFTTLGDEREKHMIMSTDTEKSLDNIELLLKTLNKLGVEGNFFNVIKGIHEKSKILNGERLPPVISDKTRVSPISPFLPALSRRPCTVP